MKEKDANKEKSVSLPELNLETIRSRQPEYFERHKAFLQKFDNGIIDEYLTLFLEMTRIALNCITEKVDKDYMYAYATIGSRWFSHIESLAYILYSGYYGDSAALARMIIGDINLLLYFGHFPEDITKWSKLADYWPQKKDEPKEIKGLRHYFLDSEIRKRLEEKQLPFDDKGTLSQAVHATAWGTQYYARKKYDKEHTSIINFGPSYDPFFAFKMRCLMVSFVRPPCDAFLNHCQQITLDALGLKEVESKYLYLLKKWESQVDKLSDVMDNIAKVEARVDAGEDFNTIVGEQINKFEEMGFLKPNSHE